MKKGRALFKTALFSWRWWWDSVSPAGSVRRGSDAALRRHSLPHPSNPFAGRNEKDARKGILFVWLKNAILTKQGQSLIFVTSKLLLFQARHDIIVVKPKQSAPRLCPNAPHLATKCTPGSKVGCIGIQISVICQTKTDPFRDPFLFPEVRGTRMAR